MDPCQAERRGVPAGTERLVALIHHRGQSLGSRARESLATIRRHAEQSSVPPESANVPFCFFPKEESSEQSDGFLTRLTGADEGAGVVARLGDKSRLSGEKQRQKARLSASVGYLVR
jgi:hypothetical protein